MTIVKCGSNLCFINCKKVPDDTVLIFATASDYDKQFFAKQRPTTVEQKIGMNVEFPVA